jgi:hypothetical protein
MVWLLIISAQLYLYNCNVYPHDLAAYFEQVMLKADEKDTWNWYPVGSLLTAHVILANN